VATRLVGDMIAQRMSRLSLIFSEMPPIGTFDLEGVSELERTDQSILLEVKANLPRVLTIAGQLNVTDIETHKVGLEEIFMTYYSRGNGGNNV
jgi:hypothetical protein